MLPVEYLSRPLTELSDIFIVFFLKVGRDLKQI